MHCIYLTEVQSSKNEIMCTEIEKICDFSAIFQKSLILVVFEFVKLNFGKSLVLEDQEELEFCIWGGIRILHCIYLVEVQSSKNEIMCTEIQKIGFCENWKNASFSFHYIIFRTSYSCTRITRLARGADRPKEYFESRNNQWIALYPNRKILTFSILAL